MFTIYNKYDNEIKCDIFLFKNRDILKFIHKYKRKNYEQKGPELYYINIGLQTYGTSSWLIDEALFAGYKEISIWKCLKQICKTKQ